MVARDYVCTLQFENGNHNPPRWKPVGKPLVISIDLDSTPSKVEAILAAIHEARGRPELIERYKLGLANEDEVVFTSLHATAEQLEEHYAGYPLNVADRTVPRELSEFTDEQLIAELQRRVTGLRRRLASQSDDRAPRP